MTDVNEVIAKSYFEQLGYIVRTNLYYKKKGKKGGAGPSDIDLIIYHPTSGKYGKRAIVSVKGWQNYRFKENFIEEFRDWDQLKFNRQELAVARKFFGTNNFNRMIVLSKLETQSRDYIIEKIENKYNIKILDFSMILEELIKNLNSKRNYANSEFLQTIRLIKKYILNKEFTDNLYVKRNYYIALLVIEELNLNKELKYSDVTEIKREHISLQPYDLKMSDKEFINQFINILKKANINTRRLTNKVKNEILIEASDYRGFLKEHKKIEKIISRI